MGRRRHYVYLLTRALPEGGCRYYVGIRSCPAGLTPATDTAYLGSGRAIRLAVAKHGRAAFSKTVLDTFENRDEAADMERALVGLATANSPHLYNLKEGGEEPGSGRVGVEGRARMSEHRAARWRDPEDRRRVSEALRGREVSDETRERIACALRGRSLSPEHVEKVRQARRGRRLSDKAKTKMAKALRGRIVSDETRARMRAAALRRVATPEGRAQVAALVGGGGGAWTPERQAKLRAAHRGKKRSAVARERCRASTSTVWASYTPRGARRPGRRVGRGTSDGDGRAERRRGPRRRVASRVEYTRP